MSLEAMTAAVIAIRAGAFDSPVAPDGERLHTSAAGPGVAARSAAESDRSAVVVLAGHAGAGSTTVALAIADAIAAQRQAQLVEYADPRRSGLGMASDSELGVDAVGWRHGRRNALHLVRMDRACPPSGQWPAPSAGLPGVTDIGRLFVLDVGHLPARALTGHGWLPTLLGDAALVVVTRITVPGVRQTEHLLGCLPGSAVLATVGFGRWPGVVAASCGPRLRAARAAGRAVMVPVVRRLEVDGLTPDPLPKPVAAAGKALAALLSPDQPVLSGLSLPPHREAPS